MQSFPLNPPPFYWKRSRSGPDLRVHEWIQQIEASNNFLSDQKWDVVMVGVPLSRTSISPSAASEFPEAFRRSWKSFSTYNIDYDLDLQSLSVADLGDVSIHVTDNQKSHQNIRVISKWMWSSFAGSFPVAIGGDHSITAMLVAGIKECEPSTKIGILQFDTHLDLRDLLDHGPTNGTPIRNLIQSGIVTGDHVYNIGVHGYFNAPSLIQYAKNQGVHYITLREARKCGIQRTVERALNELCDKVDFIYLTVDMDVLDIGVAPGAPASTPGGMGTHELFEAVYIAGQCPKVRAMDIVCLDPLRDANSQPTVKAGTHVFLSYLSGLFQRKTNGNNPTKNSSE